MDVVSAQLVPDDVMADILRRLGPHDLAVSRCVCKPWRAVIDARRMLPADSHLLPLSLAGFFAVSWTESLTAYFSRPCASVVGKFDYLDTHDASALSVEDQCNGLLLLHRPTLWPNDQRVINPVTQQWAKLPPYPHLVTPCMKGDDQRENMYLVFDPSVSPHYKVFLFHSVPYNCYGVDLVDDAFDDALDPAVKKMEWPPSSYTLRVYSSETRQWEEKPFIRQGEAAGTIGDMESALSPGHCHAAYWRRALYVHQHDFVMRITLSNDKYQVIKLPLGLQVETDEPEHYLGKSEKGVYCALLYGNNRLGLRIWFLDETCGQMEWLLKRDIKLGNLLANCPWKYGDSSWTTQYVNDEDGKSMAPAGAQFESNYSKKDDNVIASEYTVSLLGFHAYREIIFFRTSFGRAMAYHFNSSETVDMGYLQGKGPHDCVGGSFPYTPCRIGELSNNM